jgi:hypothetical protein
MLDGRTIESLSPEELDSFSCTNICHLTWLPSRDCAKPLLSLCAKFVCDL